MDGSSSIYREIEPEKREAQIMVSVRISKYSLHPPFIKGDPDPMVFGLDTGPSKKIFGFGYGFVG